MNKKRLKDVLFNNAFFTMLFLSIIMIVVLVSSVNILFKNLYSSTISNSILSVSKYFNDNLEYLSYHSSNYEKVLSSIIDEMYEEYKAGNIKGFFEIPEIKYLKNENLIKNVYYYVINKKGIIEKTNNENDLGLNLAQRVPNYWKLLNKKIDKNNGKYIERISYEIKTNNPMIYGYIRMNDDKIFEAGVALNEKVIPNFFKDISSVNFNFVKGIYSYNVSFIPFSKDFPLLDEEDKKIFNELDYSLGEINNYIVKEKSNGEKVYIYFKWRPTKPIDSPFSFAVLTKVYIDFSEMVRTKNYMIFISIILIGIFVFVFTIYINRSAFRVERPLIKLIKDIESGKVDEKTETNILEIDTLIKYYSHLVTNLVKKISEDEKELISLKEKFEMIEKEKDMLYDMALKDDLTKLFNKKGSINIFKKIISNKESFCVIYINLDNYNAVLERYSKKDADDMVLDLVDIIKKTIRDRDFAFRVNDDEFLILLRYVNLEISQKVLKRLVDFVKKFNITTEKHYKISISYGILEYNGQDVESIYIEAKKKMEEMKEKKRELLRRLNNKS